MAPRPEYYVAQPPVPPMYPAPPVYAKQETSSPIPWWVWMGAGILVANVARMVSPPCCTQPAAHNPLVMFNARLSSGTPPCKC